MTIALSWGLPRLLQQAAACLTAELPTAVAAMVAELATGTAIGITLPSAAPQILLTDPKKAGTLPQGWRAPCVVMWAEQSDFVRGDAMGADDVIWRVGAVVLMAEISTTLGTVAETRERYSQAVAAYAHCVAQTIAAHLPTATYGRAYGCYRCDMVSIVPSPFTETLERASHMQPVEVYLDAHQRIRTLAAA